MEFGKSAIHGLTFKSRCLTAHPTSEIPKFFVGTQGLKEENEIHLLEVLEDSLGEESEIKCSSIFLHPKLGEIWDLTTFQNEKSEDVELLTVCQNIDEKRNLSWEVSMWGINEEKEELNLITQFPKHKGEIKKVLTNSEVNSQIITIDEQNVYQWTLDQNGSPKEKYKHSFLEEQKKILTGAWSPLHPELSAIGIDHSVIGLDFRQKIPTFTFSAHSPFVRTIDFNSNKDHTLVTGGDDSLIKFFDLRQPSKPLQILHGHAHWITHVKYNHHHDQFLLSTGTDHQLFLWHVPTLSSETKKTRSETDRVLKCYEEHEESVYGVAWHGWWWASLSWDGRVVVNRVPTGMIDQVLED